MPSAKVLDRQTHPQARPGYYPVPLYPEVEEQGPQEESMAANPPHANGTHAMGRHFGKVSKEQSHEGT